MAYGATDDDLSMDKERNEATTVTDSLPTSWLELRSLVTEQGTLELSLVDIPPPPLASDEVLVRVQAAPINPSDLGLLLAGANMSSAVLEGTSERPVVVAPLVDGALRSLAARVGKSLSVGNEGAGIVVAAGTSPEAQSLLERDGCRCRGLDVFAVPSGELLVVPRTATRNIG